LIAEGPAHAYWKRDFSSANSMEKRRMFESDNYMQPVVYCN
jgi:hypothetical protein